MTWLNIPIKMNTKIYISGIDSKSKNNAGIYFGSSLIRPGPGTQPSKDLAGYNAARGDFDSEFDNQV